MKNIETIRPKKFNAIVDTGLYNKNKYCIHCHVKLIQNPTNTPFDKNIFLCPSCNVRFGIKETEPEEKLTTTFFGVSDNSIDNKHVYQSTTDSLPRSEYFVAKRAVERKTDEGIKDPYLQQLRKKQGIKITNIDYYAKDND